MVDLNSVSVAGRLTRDAKLEYRGELAILNFSIASNYRKKKGDEWTEEANFFNCTMFGRLAEAVSKYCTKGQQVLLGGELRQERWQTDNGDNRQRVKILVSHLQLVGGQKETKAPEKAEESGQFDDDIPF